MAILIPLTPFLWLLMMIIFLAGIGEALIEVGNNTLLIWVHRHHVGPYMNALHFFFGFGAFLSPIIVGRVLLRTDNITWAYWIIALFMVPGIIWLLCQKSPQILGSSKEGAVEHTNYLMVTLICLVFFFYVGAEIGFGGWIYAYAVGLGLSSQVTAAYLTSAFWGTLTLGRLLAIPIAAKLRPQTVLLIDFIACLLSLMIIIFSRTSNIAVWIGTIGFGFANAAIFPTLLAFAERRMKISGKISSWFGIGASSGAMTLPFLIGQLFEPFGPRVTMLAIFLDMLAAVGIFVVLILYSARLKK
jgi:FHS family Na+ dependent glucose MFS transporter 1